MTSKLIPIREFHLKNGLKLLVCERKTHPVVSCMIWYRVGSRNEGRGETGLSHFLEHMMFKGSPRYKKGEIDRLTAQLGGSNNAFTSTDYTAYYFNFSADRWRVALDIEAERMRNCFMDGKEFESEKKVVLEELKMGKDDPWRDLFQEVQSAAYVVHPYHHPVIGWAEELQGQTRDRMFNHYRRYYAPNHAVIVIAGDVKANEAYRDVKKRFNAIPRYEDSTIPAVLSEPEQVGERRILVRRPTNVRRVAIAYKTCRVGEPEDYVLDVISTVLTFGKSSRLYRKLVHSGLTIQVSTENDPRQDPGLFWVGAELSRKAESAKVEKICVDELQRNLCTNLISPSELVKAKRILTNSFYFHHETIADLAEKVGRWELQSKAREVNQYVPRIEKVTARDVREVARKFFVADRRTVGWSIPKADPGVRS